jgi:hypothetical protein
VNLARTLVRNSRQGDSQWTPKSSLGGGNGALMLRPARVLVNGDGSGLSKRWMGEAIIYMYPQTEMLPA